MHRFFALIVLVVTGCSVDGGGSVPDGGGVGSDGVGGTDPSDTDPPDPTVTDGPTWHQDVAPLLAERCGACHQAGGQAPFSVATYDEAVPWGPAMGAAIEAGTMPPFYAVSDETCQPPLPFQEDITLSDAEKQLVYDWIAADMPEGDPTTAAPAELPAVEDLEDYDVELELQEPFVVTGTEDIYQCFRIPLPNTERVYLTAMEVVPQNELVVHHVIVWADPNDNSAGQAGADGTYGCSGLPDILPTEIIGTWTPGLAPVHNPPGTGTPMDVGSSIVLNIHYHPTGTTTEVDRTKIRLQWTTEEPLMYATWFLVDIPFGASVQPGPNDQGGSEFRVPPGVPDHLETVELFFTRLLFYADAAIFAITPHMHYLGTDMRITLLHDEPDEPDQCLIHSPGFRFDFQRDYRYDWSDPTLLPVLHPDDTIRVECLYDNSPSNPFFTQHLDASGATEAHDVYWGEETGDEMCMGIVGLIVPKSGWGLFSWL